MENKIIEIVNSNEIQSYNELNDAIDRQHFGIFVYEIDTVFLTKESILAYSANQSVAEGEGYSRDYSYEVERLSSIIYESRR